MCLRFASLMYGNCRKNKEEDLTIWWKNKNLKENDCVIGWKEIFKRVLLFFMECFGVWWVWHGTQFCVKLSMDENVASWVSIRTLKNYRQRRMRSSSKALKSMTLFLLVDLRIGCHWENFYQTSRHSKLADFHSKLLRFHPTHHPHLLHWINIV
jgi:hypothetical protein